MNKELENLLLTKDFKDLSPQEKALVRSFISEAEYTEYRTFLRKSRQAFQEDAAKLQEPTLPNERLQQAIRDTYPQKYTSNNWVGKTFSMDSYARPIALAATVLLFISLLALYWNSNLFNSEQQDATKFLLEGKEVVAEPSLQEAGYSQEVTNLYAKANDSLRVELDKMNQYLVIKTQGLEEGIVDPGEELN